MKMKRLRILCVIVLFIALITAGCANTAANLKRETARYIGGGVTPEQVQISDVKRGMTEVKWTADTPKGKYNCSADDMVRRVYCTENK
jgi:hypothetical protein